MQSVDWERYEVPRSMNSVVNVRLSAFGPLNPAEMHLTTLPVSHSLLTYDEGLMTLRLLCDKGSSEVDGWASLNKALKAICKKGKIAKVRLEQDITIETEIG